MERKYGTDRERFVNKGPGWDRFKEFLQAKDTKLNMSAILEKVSVKKDSVISCGIIEFVIKKNSDDVTCAYYHVYVRRNTVEYDVLLRGFAQKHQLYDLIYLLSEDERHRILTCTWEQLWNDYWIDHSSKGYTVLAAQSKRRFAIVKEVLSELGDSIPCKIKRRPYIFPKGKPNKYETGLEAALRESREETKSKFDSGQLYFNSPIVQHYVGSDDRHYTDYYYAWLQNDIYASPVKNLDPYLEPQKEPDKTIPTAGIDQLVSHNTSDILKSTIMQSVIEGKIPVGAYPSLDDTDGLFTSRLRTETISHELESDAWIEIPIFSNQCRRIEWLASIDPYKEFGIFKRHFSAIMTIHQHLRIPSKL